MARKKINVLQFITPVGFYGAERWILTLVNNSDAEKVRHDLAVTMESEAQDLEITEQFSAAEGLAFKVPMKGRFDPGVILRLSEIVRKRQIDIIHTHGYKSDILGVILAKKNSIRCVSTPHGFGQPKSLSLKCYIKLGILALRFMDRVIPLSQQLADEIEGRGVPGKKICMIRNALDLKEIDLVEDQHAASHDKSKKKIGYIGRFDENKNVQDILRIFDVVARGHPDIELVLIGDGETRRELEKYANKLESRNAIQFLGFRPDRLEYLREFSLFLLTSKNEGIPRCVMEAMAMGIPVVAYDIEGVRQLISDRETGLLAQVGNIEEMVSHCKTILNDSPKARRIGMAGREFVRKEFSGKNLANSYLNIYQSLLE